MQLVDALFLDARHQLRWPTGDTLSFAVVMLVIGLSIGLDLWQERRAGREVDTLQRSLALRCSVLRDGQPSEVLVATVVPGDCVLLSAGSLIPADGRVIEALDFFVNQAALTGEPFPVEKRATSSGSEPAAILQSDCSVFAGSSVVSGSARVIVCATGPDSQLGQLAHTLQ